jgi:hypothetical protein
MASTLREIPTLGKPSSINPWALDSDAINQGKPEQCRDGQASCTLSPVTRAMR